MGHHPKKLNRPIGVVRKEFLNTLAADEGDGYLQFAKSEFAREKSLHLASSRMRPMFLFVHWLECTYDKDKHQVFE